MMLKSSFLSDSSGGNDDDHYYDRHNNHSHHHWWWYHHYPRHHHGPWYNHHYRHHHHPTSRYPPEPNETEEVTTPTESTTTSNNETTTAPTTAAPITSNLQSSSSSLSSKTVPSAQTKSIVDPSSSIDDNVTISRVIIDDERDMVVVPLDDPTHNTLRRNVPEYYYDNDGSSCGGGAIVGRWYWKRQEELRQHQLESARQVADLIKHREFETLSSTTNKQHFNEMYNRSLLIGGVTFLGIVGAASLTGLASGLASRVGPKASRLVLTGMAGTAAYHFSNMYFDKRAVLADLKVMGTQVSPTEPSHAADAICNHPLVLNSIYEQKVADNVHQHGVRGKPFYQRIDFHHHHHHQSSYPHPYNRSNIESQTLEEFQKVLKNCQLRHDHHQKLTQERQQHIQKQDAEADK